MGETAVKGKKELRVENWGVYFLQRLYQFYINSMNCDVKLRFPSAEVIQVHRLVLCACADYFDTVQAIHDPVYGDIYDLESHLQPDAVLPIITFMYTGKLEYPADLKGKIYEAASSLRVNILINLLKTNTQDASSDYTPDRVDTVEQPDVVSPPLLRRPENVPQMESRHRPKCSTYIHKERNAVDVNKPKPIPGRRLPIWTRPPRQTPLKDIPILSRDDGKIRVVLTDPVPTRSCFEEDLRDIFGDSYVEDALRHLCHDSGAPLTHPLILVDDNDGCSTPKKSRTELSEMKEYGKQQQIRNELICGENEEEADVDDPFPVLEPPQPPQISPLPPKPILKKRESSETSKRVRFSVSQTEENSSPAPPPKIPTPPLPEEQPKTTLTSINSNPATPAHPPAPPVVMQSPATRQFNPTPNVKLSFVPVPASLQGNVNSGELIVSEKEKHEKRIRFSVLSAEGVPIPLNSPDFQRVGNPAKIVSEMLKKYPDLVSGRRKNVKLKILTGGSAAEGKNVAYIVIHGEEEDTVSPVTRNEWNPENTNGPWHCTPCGDVKGRLDFKTYEEFRIHITEVHRLKINPAICEKCGMKTHKKNQLLYHLLTKHGVPPPAGFVFPKCTECSYVAYSKLLLAKHEEIHMSKQGLTCFTCNAAFKSSFLMNNHMKEGCKAAETERSHMLYRCPYCEQSFTERNLSQEHILSSHWKKSTIREVQREENIREDGEDVSQDDSSISSRLINSIQQPAEGCNDEEVLPAVPTEPSSELEALHHVASGISTSLLLSEPSAQFQQEDVEEIPTEEVASSEFVEGEVGCYKEELIQEDYVEEEAGQETEDRGDPYEVSQETVVNSQSVEETQEEYEQGSLEEYHSSDKDGSYENKDSIDESGIDYVGMDVSEQEVGVCSSDVASEGEISEAELTIDSQKEIEPEPMDTHVVEKSQDDHDYSPYNSVVMFQPNVVLPQRVILAPGNMLVTHPIQVLPSTTILLAPQNLITDQLVSYPYPQVVESNHQPVAIEEPERKPAAFVSDWDENSQNEAMPEIVVQPRVGPSRPEFF